MNVWMLHRLVGSLRRSCSVRVRGSVLNVRLLAQRSRDFHKQLGAGGNVNNFLVNLIKMGAICSVAQAFNFSLDSHCKFDLTTPFRGTGCQASTQRCHCTSWALTSPIDWLDLLWLLSSGNMPKWQPEGSRRPFVSLTSRNGDFFYFFEYADLCGQPHVHTFT